MAQVVAYPSGLLHCQPNQERCYDRMRPCYECTDDCTAERSRYEETFYHPESLEPTPCLELLPEDSERLSFLGYVNILHVGWFFAHFGQFLDCLLRVQREENICGVFVLETVNCLGTSRVIFAPRGDIVGLAVNSDDTGVALGDIVVWKSCH